MNALSIPGAPAWFEALLTVSAQAALLAAIIWAIVKIFGRWIPPGWRALLWFLVIARVLIPIAPPSQFSLQNLFIKNAPAQISPRIAQKFRIETSLPRDTAAQIDFNLSAPMLAMPEQANPPSPAPAPTKINVIQLLVFTWTIGAGFFGSLLLARSLMIRWRLIRHGSTPESSLLAILTDCRTQLRIRYPIRVTASDQIAAPALTGLIPARLIVPTTFAKAQFTPAQIHQILLHELAHIKQGHLFLHWLALIGRALQWFNPALHFAATRLRHECELAADAAALANCTPAERAAYGETILQVLARSTAPSSLLALGMADKARHLEQRLRALTTPANRSFHLLGIALILVVAATGLTSATQPGTTISQKIDPAQIATNQDRMVLRQTTDRKNAFAFEASREMLPGPKDDGIGSSATVRQTNLFTRSFRVDPNTFLHGLEHGGFVTSGASSNHSGKDVPDDGDKKVDEHGAGATFSTTLTNVSTLQNGVRAFFTAAGVDFNTNSVAVGGAVPAGFGLGSPGQLPQKAMFFNDRAGVLFVRATLRDLEIIENAIHALNTSPPEVSIEAKFAEFNQSEVKDLGFNWLMGNTSMSKGSAGLQGGTNSQTAPTVGNVTGILTEPQFRIAINAIENKQGVDLLSAPKVTTTSGRPIRISAEEPSTASSRSNLTAKQLIENSDRLASIQHAQKLIQTGQIEEAEGLLQHAARDPVVIQDTTAFDPTRFASSSETSKDPTKPNAGVVPSSEIPPSAVARQKLVQKLDTIRIDDFPLSTPVDLIEVVKELSFETRKLDPEHKGINFVLDKAKGRAVGAGIDLDRFKIKIDPPVRDVTVRQLCDVIVRAAAPPPGAPESATLTYSVEDYGVVFSQPVSEQEPWVTRSFRVNPNNFRVALDSLLPTDPGAERLGATKEQLRAFLKTAGVDFATNNVGVGGAAQPGFGLNPGQQPTKAVFYNDLTGLIFVRATLHDLDAIENAVHRLNMATPQVSFSVEILEMPIEQATRIMTNFAPQTNLLATNEFLFASSSNSHQAAPVLPSSKSIVDLIKAPLVATNITVPARQFNLSGKETRSLKAELESTKGVDAVRMMNVTTLVGRQARISVEETRTIVTASTFRPNGRASGITGAQVPLGWVVDCFAEYFNGINLQLTLMAANKEFLDYDKAGGDTPLPVFRVRSVGSRVKVAPGSTQALLMPLPTPKRLPVLGDVPKLEQLFEKENGASRYVLILITPVFIDAAGNILLPKSE